MKVEKSKKTFRNNPILYSQEQTRITPITEDLALGIAMGDIRQDPTDKERIKQKIRDRNKARAEERKILKAEERKILKAEEARLKAEIKKERRRLREEAQIITEEIIDNPYTPTPITEDVLESISPSFQPPSPTYGYPTSPVREFVPNTRNLFVERTPLRRVRQPAKERVRPNTQKRVSFINEAIKDAGAGNLSLGGESQSYRLRDFEGRGETKATPILQQLVKNNRNRRN